jgi:hypothetical protein
VSRSRARASVRHTARAMGSFFHQTTPGRFVNRDRCDNIRVQGSTVRLDRFGLVDPVTVVSDVLEFRSNEEALNWMDPRASLKCSVAFKHTVEVVVDGLTTELGQSSKNTNKQNEKL